MEGFQREKFFFKMSSHLLNVVLEKTLETSLDCKEIKPVNPKGNEPWIFTGRTDGEAEAPILWPPDVKSQLIRKDPDAEKGWGRRRRGWQRITWLDGIINSMDMSLSKIQEMVKDKRSLACCSPWCHKELYMTEQLNKNNTPLYLNSP